MATLYTHTTTATNSNFNNNAATDNSAWSFSPSATGIPTQLVLRVNSITGTPTANFFIRNQNTASGAITYASASGITLTAGTNTISLTGGTVISSGSTYWVWLARTSSITNFPNIFYNTSGAVYDLYKSTAANADPSTIWGSGTHPSGDISFDVNGTLVVTSGNMLSLL